MSRNSYVDISREDFEGWLTATTRSLPGLGDWYLRPGSKGLYVLTIDGTDAVGIVIRSTVGSRDQTRGKGQASIDLRLESLVVPGKVVNRKALTTSRTHRTKNWATTLTKRVKELLGAYQNSPRFYDVIAQFPGGLREYAETMLTKLHAVENWKNNQELVRLEQLLTRKRVLSKDQEDFITQALEQGVDEDFEQDSARPPAEAPDISEVNQQWIAHLERIPGWERSKFLKNLRSWLLTGRSLSRKQRKALESAFTRAMWIKRLSDIKDHFSRSTQPQDAIDYVSRDIDKIIRGLKRDFRGTGPNMLALEELKQVLPAKYTKWDDLIQRQQNIARMASDVALRYLRQ